jgi:hypothetical protein
MKSRHHCNCPCHSGSIVVHPVPCCDGLLGYLPRKPKNQHQDETKTSKPRRSGSPENTVGGSKSERDGKLLRVQATFALNLAIAIFGTAIVESSAWRVWSLIGGKTNSVSAIQAREWFLSLTIAALLGFFIGRRWLTTAIWVWTLPTALFGLGALLYSARLNGSVFGPGFAEHFFAPNCLANPLDCREFFVFTIPGARTVAYSLGAQLSSHLQIPTN